MINVILYEERDFGIQHLIHTIPGVASVSKYFPNGVINVTRKTYYSKILYLTPFLFAWRVLIVRTTIFSLLYFIIHECYI